MSVGNQINVSRNWRWNIEPTQGGRTDDELWNATSWMLRNNLVALNEITLCCVRKLYRIILVPEFVRRRHSTGRKSEHPAIDFTSLCDRQNGFYNFWGSTSKFSKTARSSKRLKHAVALITSTSTASVSEILWSYKLLLVMKLMVQEMTLHASFFRRSGILRRGFRHEFFCLSRLLQWNRYRRMHGSKAGNVRMRSGRFGATTNCRTRGREDKNRKPSRSDVTTVSH